MSVIAGIIAPVFVLVLMGSAARRWRMLRPAGLRGLNDLVFYLLLPCTLFDSVAEADTLTTLGTAAIYFAGCLTVFAATIGLARIWLRARLAQATVIGLNACYGNTVMLGLPVIGGALGADGMTALLPIVALHSVLLLPLATVLIEMDGHAGVSWRALRGTLPAVLRNPIIVAIILAFAWRLLRIPVPGPVHQLLAMLGACGPTLALLCLGASLPSLSVGAGQRRTMVETALAGTMKLLVQPALVWGLARLAGVDALSTAVAVLTAGMPTGANAFLLARRTAILSEASAGTVALTTALSVATLSGLLLLVG